MKKIIVLTVIALIGITIFGCSSSKTPVGTIKEFTKSYNSSSQEKLSNLVNSEFPIIEESSNFIRELGYDENSIEKLTNEMRTVSIEVLDVTENENTATANIKIRFNNLAEVARHDSFEAFINKEGEFQAISQNFDNVNEIEKSTEIRLIKVEDVWKIDLSNGEAKELVNGLMGNFLQASNEFFLIQEPSVEKKVITFPDNTIIFLDGNVKKSFDVNPKLANGNYIPFYSPLRDHEYFPGWNEEEKILCAIKNNDVLILPFKEMEIGGQNFIWPDVKRTDVNQYTRENIGFDENSYCELRISDSETTQGRGMRALMYRKDLTFDTVSLAVHGAGQIIDEPLKLYFDGHEIGMARVPANAKELANQMISVPSTIQSFGINDPVIIEDAYSVGWHLAEIIQINADRQVVFYQAIPYEVKEY